MRRRVLTQAGLALFVGAMAGMLLYFWRTDLETADQRASVLGLFVAVAGLALTVHGTLRDRRTPASSLVTGETVRAAREALGLLVAEQWREESRVRSLSDPHPIPVRWRLTEDAGLMDHPHLVGPEPLRFTVSSGQGADLAQAFRKLHRRRLVITGGPGSGKTTLAVRLLLELLDSAAPGEPVPVLVTLTGWDPAERPRLHDWLAVRLARDYPALTSAFGGGVTGALAGQGHVLPVLDGLDELTGEHRGAVIRALNASLADRDGFVLTSRADELAEAVAEAGDVLTAAAVIAPLPLSPSVVAGYLRACLPPRPRHSWSPVFTALAEGTAPGLTEVASTALGLWLVRAGYVAPAADPAPLTGALAQDPDRLRAHLLDRLIPAAVASRLTSRDPAEHFRPRRAWEAERMRAHLAYLARLMTAADTRDLAWWQLARHTGAGRLRTGFLAGVVTSTVAWVVIGFLGRLVYGVASGEPNWLTYNGRGWFLSGVWFGLLFGIVCAFKIKKWCRETPGSLSGGTRPRGGRRRGGTFRGAAVGFVLGVAVGLGYGSASGASILATALFGLAIGLLFGLTSGLVYGLSSAIAVRLEAPTAGTAGTPLSSLRDDRALNLVRLVVLDVVFTVLFGLAYGLLPGAVPVAEHRVVVGVVSTVGVALMFGPLFAASVGEHHGWPAYLVATHRLARRRLLPRDLMSFLDDAHRLGLLRTVGPIYQFRHAALQDHFALSANNRK
ncbi:NACHT domain-containing protein [Streptosporangium sp. NPDC000239]|uniref:NACHT domain-containing protein n=1 Tax=Streptosporangium sp. NPDC000239 TaxID=3154248 RepID=UPI003321311D